MTLEESREIRAKLLLLCGFFLFEVALEGLHALTTGDDDTHTVIVDLIADGLRNLGAL